MGVIDWVARQVDNIVKRGQLPSLALGLLATLSILVIIIRVSQVAPIQFVIGLGVLTAGASAVSLWLQQVIANNPDASASPGAWIIAAAYLGFMIISRPQDLADGIQFTYLFVLGMVFFIIMVGVYSVVEKLNNRIKNLSFREEALISSGTTIVIMLILITIASRLGVFNLFSMVKGVVG